MSRHRISFDSDTGNEGVQLSALPLGAVVTIRGDEAAHGVRVKRLSAGEEVELLDGRGTVAIGVVEGAGTGAGGASKEAERRGRGAAKLDVRITLVRRVEPVVPRLEVWSATPKGSRVDELVDGLCQVGVAGWFALETARGVVDPRGTKLERLRKIAAEAGKQCGRAWRMEVEGPLGLGRALAPAAGAAIVVADAAGEPFVATGARLVRLLIGPEGGWSPGELERARGAGARINRFGPHTMRIETAAVAAAAVVMAVEGR